MTAWLSALAGGVLIGLAATLLLWLNGRVAGVSGILNGVIFPKTGDIAWRSAFLIGLILAGGLYMAFAPDAFLPRTDYSRAALVVAGVLVGGVADRHPDPRALGLVAEEPPNGAPS